MRVVGGIGELEPFAGEVGGNLTGDLTGTFTGNDR
jgi:hypothetical protein